MSQQVFVNPRERFEPMPGSNFYTLSAAQPVVTDTQVNLTFADGLQMGGVGAIRRATVSAFTVGIDGSYAFALRVSVKRANDAEAISATLLAEIASANAAFNGAVVALTKINSTLAGGTGAAGAVLTLNFSVFLKAGDSIAAFKLTNTSGADITTIVAGSELVISRTY